MFLFQRKCQESHIEVCVCVCVWGGGGLQSVIVKAALTCNRGVCGVTNSYSQAAVATAH